MCFPSIAPTAWGKLHTSLNLLEMPFQPSSDEGILRKGSFTVSVTILLIVILPTQKLYDKECCDSLQAIYFNVISK